MCSLMLTTTIAAFFFVISLFTPFAWTTTITRQLFDRSLQRRSSNHCYRLQIHRAFIQDQLLSPALPCLLYCKVINLMNYLEDECSWRCLLEISINENILVLFMLLLFVSFGRIFETEVIKPQLLSSNTPRFHSKLTKLLTLSPALSCLLYFRVNSLMNILDIAVLFILLLFVYFCLLVYHFICWYWCIFVYYSSC